MPNIKAIQPNVNCYVFLGSLIVLLQWYKNKILIMANIAAIDTYTINQVHVAKMAKALGHPARIAIVELLSKGAFTCNEIVNTLPLAQSTVSQHLKELKGVNLVDALDIHPKTIYSLNMINYKKFKTLLKELLIE